MYNNVGLRSTKGAGISGFLEKNRAFRAVRQQYSFDAVNTAAPRVLSGAAKRAVMSPSDAAADYAVSVLGAKAAEDLHRRLLLHDKLRQVQLDGRRLRRRLLEEREKACPPGGSLAPDDVADVDAQVRQHQADRLTHIIAELEAEEDHASSGGTAPPPPKKRTAESFRAAFGVSDGVIGALADDEVGNADVRFISGSSFDRRRQAIAKENAEAKYREERELRVAQAVLARVQSEAAALRLHDSSKKDLI